MVHEKTVTQSKDEGAQNKIDSEEDVGSSSSRENWTGRLDFIMSALSFCVGMGNLWRFPYLCYKNGGGAFLLPYIVCMVLAGYPLMFIEMALGQYTSRGVVAVWKSVPLFEGIGWGMISVSVLTGLYYNVIVTWCVFYFFSSFNSDVPWRDCGHTWNGPGCTTGRDRSLSYNCTQYNGTWVNSTCVWREDVSEAEWNAVNNASLLLTRTSPSEDYFNNYMLGVSGGLHDMGAPRWHLTLCFLFCWLLVFVSLAKGIKVSGKVTYVTALLPYVVLLILLVRGVTLEGSTEGILYYITPVWSKLLSPQVWSDAAIQAFFSLSLCWGGLITMAGYNKFNNNCLKDAIVVATGDMLTSVFGGFVIFAILGYMSHEMRLPMEEVVSKGPGLAFIVYPEAITTLPVSPLWSLLFMLMLINVGLGSQMGLVACVHTSLVEVFHKTLSVGHRSLLTLVLICVSFFLLGITMTTNGGVYVLLLMDSYSATYSVLVLDLLICLAVGYVYGWRRFYKDIERMLGYRISYWWMICWRYVDPVLIILIFSAVLFDFKRSSYRDYVFPVHYEVVGWCLSLVSILCVPAVALYKLCTLYPRLSLKDRLAKLCTPADDWGPCEERHGRSNLGDEELEIKVKLNTADDVEV